MVEMNNSNEAKTHAFEYLLDYNCEEKQESKNGVVLPALNSNNIAFDIFSFFPQLEAQIKLRSLSKKGLEKSFFLHNHCRSPRILSNLKKFELRYGFKIGAILMKRDAEVLF